jgi:hypothetical protein
MLASGNIQIVSSIFAMFSRTQRKPNEDSLRGLKYSCWSQLSLLRRTWSVSIRNTTKCCLRTRTFVSSKEKIDPETTLLPAK